MPCYRPNIVNKVPKVLHIAGYSRTGSTLLSRVLAQAPGFVAIGEMSAFWSTLRDNERCGCGQPIRDCAFWSKVLDRTFDGVANMDLLRCTGLQEEFLDRPSALKWPRIRGEKRSRAFHEYLDLVQRIYQAISHEAACKVIVDSTKVPHFSYLLKRTGAFDVRVLHLVRDSRAVVRSWQRPKKRVDTQAQGSTMPEKQPHLAALGYDIANVETHLLRLAGLPYQRLRYEDFTRDPVLAARSVLNFLGEEGTSLDFIDNRGVTLSQVSHTIWGNPDRTQMGYVPIREDDEWRTKLAGKDKAIATVLTWPLLAGYGYVGPFGNRR